ncbi:MAG: hypothetical protein ACMUIE_00610 [Thermoplasmatota archaeon]
MILSNDEMVLWTGFSHMVIGGDITGGELIITNKRLCFVTEEQKKSIFSNRKLSDLWELDVWKIMDIELIDTNSFKEPVLRFRYKEGETYFTFPKLEPRPTLAAVIVIINHARLINKNISLLRSINDGLAQGSLKVGERLPKLVIDQPMRTDQTCHQCAKDMLESESDLLSNEIKECLVCGSDE